LLVFFVNLASLVSLLYVLCVITAFVSYGCVHDVDNDDIFLTHSIFSIIAKINGVFFPRKLNKKISEFFLVRINSETGWYL